MKASEGEGRKERMGEREVKRDRDGETEKQAHLCLFIYALVQFKDSVFMNNPKMTPFLL